MDEKNTSENIAAAPGTITLGERTFLVDQHSHADGMAIRKWLKKHVTPPLQMYAELVSDPHFKQLPEHVRDELAREAGQLKMRGETPLTEGMIENMLMEPKHCRFFAWITLRKRHPDLQLEELTPLITEENAAVVCGDLLLASGWDSKGN